MTPRVGRGEVELEHLKKKGTQIEVKLQVEPECVGEAIEVRLNDALLYTVPPEKNSGGRIYVVEKVDFNEPAEGDIVSLCVRGEVVLSGPLIRD